MESLKDILQQAMPNLATDKKYWINFLEQHKDINEFIVQNEISNETINSSLTTLYQYIDEKANCASCVGLAACPNLLKGHYSKLEYSNGQIQNVLVRCAKLKQQKELEYRRLLFKSQYIPNDIVKATFKDIDQIPERQKALAGLLEFCKTYEKDSNIKGIYLNGPLGVGKSHMMAAAANKLAEKGISTLMIYVPDFFREIKNSISDNTLNEKIALIQDVEVLILDDIGAETISQWERDEILGAILQARMVKGLPTLYTSNLDYDALEEHLSYSNKGGEEGLKAKRIMERIRHFTTPYFVDGPNRRKR